MLPNINSQNEMIQQDFKTPSHYTSLQSIDLQSKAQQGNKKQQSQENRSVKGLDIDGVDTKKTKFRASNITLSPTGSPSDSTRSTGQEIIKPIEVEDIDKKIDAMTKALAEIDNDIKSMGKNTIAEEVVIESDNSIYDDIYEKREIKPRLIVGSSDINYERDKGGNHRMTLRYYSDNSIRFSKDDNPVIIIKNDNVKNEGDYWNFVTDIRKCCKQKMSDGGKYYFEDYLDDNGFIEKEIDINEIRRKIELLRKKKFGGIQK